MQNNSSVSGFGQRSLFEFHSPMANKPLPIHVHELANFLGKRVQSAGIDDRATPSLLRPVDPSVATCSVAPRTSYHCLNLLFLTQLSTISENVTTVALRLRMKHALNTSITLLYTFAAAMIIPVLAESSQNIVCRNTDVWTQPSWPANIGQQCSEILSTLPDTQPEVHQRDRPIHEFLPAGMMPAPSPNPPVRTPWRMVNGTFYYPFFHLWP